VVRTLPNAVEAQVRSDDDAVERQRRAEPERR
jgi:hypothetical protein